MDFYNKYAVYFGILFVISMFIEQAFCILILGILIGIISIESLFIRITLNRIGVKCNGEIDGIESDNENFKTPKIKFKTLENEEIIGTPSLYVSTSFSQVQSYKSKIGREIPIIYNPNNPIKFELYNEKGYGTIGIIVTGILSFGLLILGTLELTGIINKFN
ncbi:hypothetical protein KFE94_08915 [bacterium SCSIO 12643]|nr:hypothetical protein KFE94_08915 [bacterium SCSIO 12643]